MGRAVEAGPIFVFDLWCVHPFADFFSLLCVHPFADCYECDMQGAMQIVAREESIDIKVAIFEDF